MKKKLGELTVAIEPTKSGFKSSLYYEGGPFKQEDHERVLAEVKGKTEDEVMTKARDWLAKRTCRNGVELEKKTKGVMQIHCNACGAVVYRGVPISWT